MLVWRVPAEAVVQGASARRRRLYRRLVAVLVTVALGYPLWWLATPAGFGLVGAEASLGGFAALDLLSKPVYGWLLLRAVRTLPDADGA
jgi:bacteriorhodopsin